MINFSNKIYRNVHNHNFLPYLIPDIKLTNPSYELLNHKKLTVKISRTILELTKKPRTPPSETNKINLPRNNKSVKPHAEPVLNTIHADTDD